MWGDRGLALYQVTLYQTKSCSNDPNTYVKISDTRVRVCATTDFGLGWINQSEFDVLCGHGTFFLLHWRERERVGFRRSGNCARVRDMVRL